MCMPRAKCFVLLCVSRSVRRNDNQVGWYFDTVVPNAGPTFRRLLYQGDRWLTVSGTRLWWQ